MLNVPGFSIHEELGYLVNTGLTPYEALVTGTRNVPLNDALARATADEEGMALWRQYLVDWTRWNHVRSAACVVSLAGHAVALAAVANG